MDQQAYSMVGGYTPINTKPLEIRCLKCGSNCILKRERQDQKIKEARKKRNCESKKIVKRANKNFKDYVCIKCFHEFSKEDYSKRYER